MGGKIEKNSVILSQGATLLTFEVLEVTNFNILLTISKYNHEKGYENRQNDHQRENALLFYQILSANSLKKCMEVAPEN